MEKWAHATHFPMGFPMGFPRGFLIMGEISFAKIFRPDAEIKREFRVVLTFTTDHFSTAVEFAETLFDRMFEKSQNSPSRGPMG